MQCCLEKPLQFYISVTQTKTDKQTDQAPSTRQVPHVFSETACEWSLLLPISAPDFIWGILMVTKHALEQSHTPKSLSGQHRNGNYPGLHEMSCDKQHWVSWSWSMLVFSVFSIVYRLWAGWGPPTGLRSKTGGWRGHFPACGSSPPWRWCGSSHRCRLRCSTAPTRRPPPAAWWHRQGGSAAADQTASVKHRN